jgi:DNA segregation ATPase FtsK/SpoIIIE-like protein
VLTESGGLLKATYPDKVRDDVDDVRASFADVLSAKMRGRWKAAWDTAGNTATFERRPSMPAVVPHPVPTDSSDTWRLPLGVDENGDVVSWDLKVAPHGLVVGSTGSGKSVVLSGVIVEALARGFEVVVIDAKGTTLAGFRRVPGVTRTGLGEPEDMAEAMEETEALMRERYRSVREDGAEPDDFTPVLIVLDEAAEYATNVSRWWKSEGAAERGSKVRDAPALDSWRSIARLGRECHVHLVVGIQQAAAGFFGGTESRDQLPARIACGPLTQEAARMTFGRSDVGRDVPKDAKGRATVDLGSGPVEVQMWWTPTPKPNGVYRDEDAALLQALLPS